MTQQHQTTLASQPNSTAQTLRVALRILRIKQLMERTGLSRATLYVLMKEDPTFPSKVRLTARCVGWLEESVDAWILARAQMSSSNADATREAA